MSQNIHPIFDRLVSRNQQELLLNQKGAVLWFTGLSGSGKSTICESLQKSLYSKGYLVKVLDGDNIRSGINKGLGFTLDDRQENISRIAEVAKLFAAEGVIVLCSFVSPTRAIRKLARDIIGGADFVEIFVDAPLSVCEDRDVKGLYKKARAGELKGMTGIDSPFERPEKPDLLLDTTQRTVESSAKQCLQMLENKQRI